MRGTLELYRWKLFINLWSISFNHPGLDGWFRYWVLSKDHPLLMEEALCTYLRCCCVLSLYPMDIFAVLLYISLRISVCWFVSASWRQLNCDIRNQSEWEGVVTSDKRTWIVALGLERTVSSKSTFPEAYILSSWDSAERSRISLFNWHSNKYILYILYIHWILECQANRWNNIIMPWPEGHSVHIRGMQMRNLQCFPSNYLWLIAIWREWWNSLVN